jgi:hypothetical protein
VVAEPESIQPPVEEFRLGDEIFIKESRGVEYSCQKLHISDRQFIHANLVQHSTSTKTEGKNNLEFSGVIVYKPYVCELTSKGEPVEHPNTGIAKPLYDFNNNVVGGNYQTCKQ